MLGQSFGDVRRRLPGGEVYYALSALRALGFPTVGRMPRSLRVILESLLRNCDGVRVTTAQVEALANWRPGVAQAEETPFTVGRVVMNCAAGIPLLGDLAAMRGAVAASERDATVVSPHVQLDLVLDHTLTVDFYGSNEALDRNMALDIERNSERYRFVKWAMQAYGGIRLFPPGNGILHQLNLEYLSPGLLHREGVVFPDTLVGTDSHTCMIAGLGVVGWGVGGIEAEGAVMGQPVYLPVPNVVGVQVTGQLSAGVTATDLVLHVTEMLRKARVVGSFVEFFGGTAALTVPDRATVANMAPEYGALIGYFPVDEQTCGYLRQTGRPEADVALLESYFRAQGCFGAPQPGEIDYSRVLTLDLGDVVPCVAGPKRPQDRIPLPGIKQRFAELLVAPVTEGGYGRPAGVGTDNHPRDGDVVLAAITSCTNTSNPGVMLAAGLLARNAVARGLSTRPWVKTSLTPGSLVVGRYLAQSGLQQALDQLGFNVVGYSCATCVGASGPIDPALDAAIAQSGAIACAVLSGNRNFEARIHPAVRAAFLASPPLVVAFALAGRVGIDLASEPLGTDQTGAAVFLRDIWPSQDDIAAAFALAVQPESYRAVYGMDPEAHTPGWAAIAYPTGALYPWDGASTYILEPPFLGGAFRHSVLLDVVDARALLVLGDSITTDHICPISTIRAGSPAGQYLARLGVPAASFNNYGARRMNHEVMLRGGFANAQLRNRLAPGSEGGVTVHQPSLERMTVFDAAMRYQAEGTPLVVVAGDEYGTGSARDWAAKVTRLLGVRAVIAGSFERIHRSNLVGMGVLPCQLPPGVTATSLALDGTELLSITGLGGTIQCGQELCLSIRRADACEDVVPVKLRIDTEAELRTMYSGGMMPFMLGEMMARARAAESAIGSA